MRSELLKVGKKEVKMSQKKIPVILTRKEVEKLLRQPNEETLIGLRNLAILTLILSTGLRVSEVCNLKFYHIDLESGTLKVVQGKGQKDRNLAIPDYEIEVLRKWQSKNVRSPFFFSALNGNQLSPRYLQRMVKRYARKARITKAITPHTLRHQYATQYYRQTKDLESLRLILGHEAISTTQIYITLSNEEVEATMRAFKGY